MARISDKAHADFPAMSETEVRECQKCIRGIYRGTKFESMKKPTLVQTCYLRSITLVKGKKPESLTKEVLYNALATPVSAFGFLRSPSHITCKVEAEKQAKLPPGFAAVNGGAVLGADVMRAIWDDMRNTILPSWVGVAPKNWGTKKRGKLSADHWRSVLTVHLPITLIWFWRRETGRKKALLSNMLDLVVAVRVANFKETNADISAIYDKHISRYVEEAAALFREDNITPSMHSATHIGHNLRDFGPSHSRGAQFYERYIHHLQRQNTNMKFGSYSRSGCDIDVDQQVFRGTRGYDDEFYGSCSEPPCDSHRQRRNSFPCFPRCSSVRANVKPRFPRHWFVTDARSKPFSPRRA